MRSYNILGTYWGRHSSMCINFLKLIFKNIFIERGKEKERERNINGLPPLWTPTRQGTKAPTWACYLTRNQTQ